MTVHKHRTLRWRAATAALALGALLAPAALASPASADSVPDEFKVLVFSKTTGFRHDSIPNGIAAIQKLGQENGFGVDATEDSTKFTDENLAQYQAVIWLSTTGDPLNTQDQRDAFERYIQRGGGYAGIHAAADTHYSWSWYGKLVGAYFKSHPAIQNATVKVEDPAHPSTKHLPTSWTRNDEWYDYQSNPRNTVHVLTSMDEKSYSGATMGIDHPNSWCQDYDGGHSWYTALGHTKESFTEDNFLKMVLGGIKTAAGVEKADCAASQSGSFEKVTLDSSRSDPMMLDVANDGRVFYIDRMGDVKIIKPGGAKVTAGHLNVFTDNESGLLGVALDRNFDSNHWLYLFYSPAGSENVDRLSRFTVTGDTIDMSSEKKVLDVPVQRAECCHHGGGMVMDPKTGDLYLATGDNTNPFASDAYSPHDERPGRAAWDAQRSSGNTNSLSGKLLRIHPEADGTYTVPEGNLFAPGTAKTKPEIYGMGFRNPFRIGMDPKTGHPLVADYGPDAGAPSPTRGPENAVEWNLVTRPGNYGWPYCLGPNKAYIKYDFATGKSGETFDCDAPVNNSPNNTGLTNLPPAIPATIWYHYQTDPNNFPELNGGAPMAGPVYRYDENLKSDVKWPAYWDNKALFGEWNNNKMFSFQLNEDSTKLVKINQILKSMSFKRPMDIKFGPDGAMYLIEWGSGFNGNNADSGIYRIEYRKGDQQQGDQRPVVTASANPTSGIAPLKVDFTASATDPGNLSLTYKWDFGVAGAPQPTTANASYTYTVPGTYTAAVTVTNSEGAATTKQISIKVDAPNTICLAGRSDDFNGTELDRNRWSVIRENQGLKVEDGNLVIPTSNTDIYGDNAGSPNIVVQPAPSGAWMATTKVTLNARDAYQQAGLILYGDDDNYAKMVLQARGTNSKANRIFQFIREENGDPKEVTASNTAQLGDAFPDTAYVRFISDGTNLTAHYSADGVSFTAMPETKKLAGINNPKIGLFSIAGTGNRPVINAYFDWFHITPDDTATKPAPNDEFDGTELNTCRWDASVRYNASAVRVKDGNLEIDTEKGDIYGSDNSDAKNFILQTAPDGDWTLETKIDGSALNEQYQQGGLIVYAGDDDYVKFDYVIDNQPGAAVVRRIELRSEVGGVVQDPQPQVSNLTSGVWWLRMKKEGDTFHGYYSSNGTDWTEIGVNGTPTAVKNSKVAGGAKVGLFAFGANQTASKTAKFDYFHLSKDGDDSPAVPLTVTASSRCVGTSAYVAVTAVNGGDVPATVTLTTPYGAKTVADVATGKQAYQSFNARAGQIGAGKVTVTGTATIDGKKVTSSYEADYTAISCG
ncbi:ThuA domain-containing protein [Sphaerisporangium sp. NBC_01403]|uniref:ThuA domain-containing protein n=1 Tax=Sphaerisporangium sp. NBC_01403 TaxID=2903599 RepID=UPI003245F2FA